MDADAPTGGVRVHASLPEPDRRSRLATVVSFLLHALIIYLAIRITASVALPEHSPLGDAIQMVLGGGGGGGGQGGQAFDHAKAPPPPPTPVPPPVMPPPPPPAPTVVPQTVTPPPPAAPPAASTEPPSASTVAGAGTGTGTGGGNGSGTGTGTGSGQGPGSGSGTGGGNGGGTGGFGPDPKQLIVPGLDAPKELRGKNFEVIFSVTATGVVSDVKITPPIANKGYAKKFDEAMRGYTFRPARDAAGNKIAGTYVYTFTMGGQ